MQERNFAFRFIDEAFDDAPDARPERPKLQLIASAPRPLRLPARRRFSLRINDGGFRPYRSFSG